MICISVFIDDITYVKFFCFYIGNSLVGGTLTCTVCIVCDH